MATENRLVTLGGECFELVFEREEPAWPNRAGSYHLFRLKDIRSGRGERLISLFGSEQIKLLNPRYAAHIESARVNAIRRGFDSGELSFDNPYDEHTYKTGLELKDSDLNTQPLVSDSEIRQLLIHKAYWVGYMDSLHPDYPVNFETPDDLGYLGANSTDIRRNVLRLKNQGMLDKVMDGFGRATEKLIAEYESKKSTSSESESRMTQTELKVASHQGLLVFISHSSKDADLATALIDLLKDALALTANQIRCSSVDGYRLPVGVNTEKQLRDEVNAAKIVIGLVTPSSLDSSFVMFELGARWGANLFLAPLMAGVKARNLSGPLSLLNALDATNDAQLHQLVFDISQRLSLPLQSAASYQRHVAHVKELAGGVLEPVAKHSVSAASKLDLVVSLSAEGTPPSQVLKIAANQPVAVSRVEYMSSSEACIAGEDVSRQGAAVEVPVNGSLLGRLWNTPRPDRNHNDHSGPAKIGVTVSADGKTRQYILPVQMDVAFLNSTMYTKLIGSKTFRET